VAAAHIFLSSVSAEFRSYRDALRHDLDRPNVTVKVQEDFIATGTETLDMLDDYIKQCNAVIHLVGNMTGSMAQAPSVTFIRERYNDFDKRLPVLAEFLRPDGPALPYTQWEAWLALYHRKPLIICVPEEGAPRDERYQDDEAQRAIQQEHLHRLADVERYPGIRFANADRLAVDVLRSRLQEVIASANMVQGTSGRIIDFTQERMRHGEIVGRELAIATVRGWIDASASGWILIKGGPGTGKSAIMAAILDQLEKEFGVDSVPYHFLRRDQSNWSEPDAVLPNLIARLEQINTLPEPIVAQGLDRLSALLTSVAEQYDANKRRLVLIVDGLDEAGAGNDAEGVLGRFLPTTLPDNVFLISASRPNYPELGWMERRLGLHTIDLDQPPWLADNRSVVDAYWRKQGPQLEPPLAEDVLEKAIDAADGNMLHAVMLRDAFAGNTQARDPNRIPVGFKALLEELWGRLVELNDREKSSRVIAGLGLLAVAREALPLGLLARLLDWDHPADITDFKRYARPFLLEENADWHGGEARYRPFHESMRDFLSSGDRMQPQVRRRYHELLARRLAAWPPAEEAEQLERDYATRFALVHLTAIADWEQISKLLGDLRYCVAALKTIGPQLLLAHIAALPPAGLEKAPQLVERANVLQRVLRLESQWLQTYPHELPTLLHNSLTCRGWSREQIRTTFSGFDRGWGLINPVAIGDEICILRGHSSNVRACDLDRGGRYGVSGSWDGTLRVWDLSRGTNVHSLRPRPGALRCDVDSCAISPDGHYIVAAMSLIESDPRREYGLIQIWDARVGELLHDFELEKYNSARVAFATNDQAVVGHRSGQVDVYDLPQAANRQLLLDEEIVGTIAVNGTGTLIAALTNNGCGVWRLDDGERISTVPLEKSAQTCSFGPDDTSVAIVTDNQAIVANSADGSVLHRVTAFTQISDCRLLDNQRLLLTTAWDCELVVWDMEADQAITRYEGHTYTVECCAVTQDGRVALTGGGDHTVRLWSLVEKINVPEVDRHSKLVYGCTVNATATLACSAPQDDRPTIWNARTGTRVGQVDADVAYGSVRFCRFEGRSSLAVLGRALLVFDPETSGVEWETELPFNAEDTSTFFVDRGFTDGAPDGIDELNRLPIFRTGSNVIVWKPGRLLEPVPLPERDAIVSGLNAGQAIAICHQDIVETMRLDGSKNWSRIAEEVETCVGAPRSNSVYVVRLNGQVVRLDAASGKVLSVLGEIKQKNIQLLIDPEETVLWAYCFSGPEGFGIPTEQTLIAFSLKTSSVMQQISLPGYDAMAFCFLSGMLITAGWSDATLHVWDPHQPEPVATILSASPFRCVAAAGDRIVAGDQKGNVWFLAPMKELYP
jgi:WD40 repeat protein